MVSSTRRRSVRQKPVKKEPPKVAPPPDSDEEVRMPEGYNPSDDSEEEYVPPAKKTKVSLTRRRSRKQTSGSDSEPEEEENQKPNKKAQAQSIKRGVKQAAGRKSQSAILNPPKNTPTSKATKTSKTIAETVITSPSPVTKLPETAKSETLVKKEPEQHILCPFQRLSLIHI